MENYKNVLLALDLHPDCDNSIIEQARKVVKDHNAKLTIIHAVEHLNAYGVAQAYPSILEVEEQLIAESKETLAKLKEQFDLKDAKTVVDVGSPKMVILDYAQEHDCDLVILGSHGRHGINMLLGSTANAVLHNAHCDVLAIRIKHEEK